MKYFPIIAIMFLVIFGCKKSQQNSPFIKVINGEFILDSQPYNFKGANYWQGMNLGAPVSGDRERLIRELDNLKGIGITNLRILGASEADSSMKFAIHPALQTAPGKYNEDLWKGLDFLLAEMAKRNMKAVVVLGNFWTWSGGFPQYLKWSGAGEIPYPQEEGTTWQQFTDYSKQFYTNSKAVEMMDNHIKTILNRTNSITGVAYKNDPTIMAWQLANEPRGYDVPYDFVKWTQRTSQLIKKLDKNHLVCLGTEGNASSKNAGIDVLRDNDNPNIDYVTMHIWMQNWGWYKPGQSDSIYSEAIKKVNNYWGEHVKVAQKLNKPIVLEEFGIARDGSSYSPDTTTIYRDRYFNFIFKKVEQSIKEGAPVKGLNFWSYSGEGRPSRPGEYWQKGDSFLGDPPHELQGWYGVYDSDSSTLELIKGF